MRNYINILAEGIHKEEIRNYLIEVSSESRACLTCLGYNKPEWDILYNKILMCQTGLIITSKSLDTPEGVIELNQLIQDRGLNERAIVKVEVHAV